VRRTVVHEHSQERKHSPRAILVYVSSKLSRLLVEWQNTADTPREGVDRPPGYLPRQEDRE
jgi:hypothetical protein